MEDAPNKPRLTIGRLARVAGVNVETIRYYHRCGLLQTPQRAPGRVRTYGEKELGRLWLIMRGKEAGFTLSEIARLAGHVERGNCAALRELASEKLRTLSEEIRGLEKARGALRKLFAGCRGECVEGCPVIRRIGTNGFRAP